MKDTMNLKKVCKHSVVYESVNPDAPIKSVYVMKSALPPGEFPATVTLTLETS